VPPDADDTDELVVEEDRNTEQRSIADHPLCPERVVGVGQDIGDLHRLPGQCRPSYDGRPVTQMRMFDGVVVALGVVEDLRDDHEDVALREIELAVLPLTQASCRRDDRVEHGLEPFGARHRAEDLVHRLPLLAQVRVLSKELLDVERLAPSHPADSSPTGWGVDEVLMLNPDEHSENASRCAGQKSQLAYSAFLDRIASNNSAIRSMSQSFASCATTIRPRRRA